ncbi:MAG: hypothetical protein U0R19_37910 [Bryobacteraceae bacterium]
MTKDEMYECLIYQAAAVGPWPVRYIRDTVNWERLNWPQYRHFQQAELTVVFDDLVALSRILIDTVAPGVADRHGPQYRMSIAASQRWEKWARPNWELFYEEKYLGANKCQIRGNNATLLERLLRNGLGGTCSIAHNSVVWTKLESWCPTYWKTLKEGWEIRFDCCPDNEFEDLSSSIEDWRLIPGWFVPHWELSRWPLAND